MPLDERAKERKRTELYEVVRISNTALSASEIARILDALTSLTAPEEPERVLEKVTLFSHSLEGESRKPGNLVLNWRRLIDIVPDAALASLGVATTPGALQPWAFPLAALYVWNKVWKGIEEPISEIEGSVLLALWKNRDHNNRISEEDGLQRTNELRTNRSARAITTIEYTTSINRLARLHCIELTGGTIWLREWVKVKYM